MKFHCSNQELLFSFSNHSSKGNPYQNLEPNFIFLFRTKKLLNVMGNSLKLLASLGIGEGGKERIGEI